MIARQVTKHDFRPLTDELQRHGFVEAKDYARFVAAFQAKLGIECGTRDRLPIEKLVDLQGAQVKLTTLMQCGHTPWQALSRLASA